MTGFWTDVERWRDAGRALVPAAPQDGPWQLDALGILMHGTGPVAGPQEREVARLGCVIDLVADTPERGLAEVMKAAGTVLVTDTRVVLAAKSGPTSVGAATTSHLVLASLPWSLVDEVTLAARSSLADRLAGGRLVTLTNYSSCLFRLQLLACAQLSPAPHEQPTGRASAQQLFDSCVQAGATWRLTATRSAGERARLQQLVRGPHVLEDGLHTARLLEVVDDQAVLPARDPSSSTSTGPIGDGVAGVLPVPRATPGADGQLAQHRGGGSRQGPANRRPVRSTGFAALALLVTTAVGLVVLGGRSGDTAERSAAPSVADPVVVDGGPVTGTSLGVHPVLAPAPAAQPSSRPSDVVGTSLVDETGQPMRIGPAALTRSDVEQAEAEQVGSVSVVSLALSADGARKWNVLTGQAACSPPGQAERRVAIVVDGRVISSPQVDPSVACGVGVEGRAVQITGSFTARQAEDLAQQVGGRSAGS